MHLPFDYNMILCQDSDYIKLYHMLGIISTSYDDFIQVDTTYLIPSSPSNKDSIILAITFYLSSASVASSY